MSLGLHTHIYACRLHLQRLREYTLSLYISLVLDMLNFGLAWCVMSKGGAAHAMVAMPHGQRENAKLTVDAASDQAAAPVPLLFLCRLL